MATALPKGFRRQRYDSVPSTNSLALERARGGDEGRLWVTADEQTQGRGRRGRHWVTARGNLAASLLLIDPAPPAIAATVSFVAGLALFQSIVDLAGPGLAQRLRLKWPNDLLLDRLKVAGILVEGEKLHSGRFAVVIGIGVNCQSHPGSRVVQAAGDLLAAGVDLDAERIFERLATHMAHELSRWGHGAGFAETRVAWLARSVGLGEPITVNLPGHTVEGSFDTVDGDGRLVLTRQDGGREAISAGDLFFATRG